MARKARKIGIGDILTLQVEVVSAGIVDGKVTFTLNGQNITIPEDLEVITNVKPHNWKSACDRGR